MSKKISSGILLLIFSVVAVDLQASLKDSLNEKVAAAKEKIKKIELKDVLNYTVKAAVITGVSVLAVLQYKNFQMNKELLSKPSGQGTDVAPAIQALNTKVDGIQESFGDLDSKIKSHGLSGLINITEGIKGLVAAILEDRQKTAKGEQTETTVTEVETEKRVDNNLEKVQKELGSALNKLRDKKEKVKKEKGKKKSKRKVF